MDNRSYNSLMADLEAEEDFDDESDKYLGGVKGIPNLGNTCFLNAALQALAHVTPLKKYFLHTYTRRIRHQSDISVDNLFENFIRTMWAGGQSSSNSGNSGDLKEKNFFTKNEIISNVVIRGLVTYVWKNFQHLSPGEQHDSQEFLHCFLNDLHESLKVPDYSNFDAGYISPPPPCDANGEHFDLSHFLQSNSKSESFATTSNEAEKILLLNSLNSFVENLSKLSDSQSVDRSYYEKQIELFIQFTKQNPLLQLQPSTTLVEDPQSPSIGSKQTIRSSKIFFPSSSSSSRSSATVASGGQSMKNRSIIRDIFSGELENTIRCTNCNNVSTQIETFQDLSIPINVIDRVSKPKYGNSKLLSPLQQMYSSYKSQPDSQNAVAPFFRWPFVYGAAFLNSYYSLLINWFDWLYQRLSSPFTEIMLTDCLNMFFNSELLENENRYKCENCHKLCNGIKCMRIHRLPEILIIHMNRYENINSNLRKISSNLSFPLVDFSMRPYMSGTSIEIGLEEEDYLYDLVAIICHSGSQVSNGHYICYALNEENDEWYEFDDYRVRQVNKSELLSYTTSNAYILFYQRNCSQRSNRALNVVIDIERIWLEKFYQHKVEMSDPFVDYYFISRPKDYHYSKPVASVNLKSFLLSRYWLHCFLNHSNPGPMENADILCPHRLIRPTEWLFINTLSLPLIEPVGQFLWLLYGGGPLFDNSLTQHICEDCTEFLDNTRYRRFKEYSNFQSLQTFEGSKFRTLRLKKLEANIVFEPYSEQVATPKTSVVEIEELDRWDSLQESPLVDEPERKVDIYEKFTTTTDEDNYYYFISAEWMDRWLRFIKVNFDHPNISGRDRQLSTLYMQIVKNNSESKESLLHYPLKTDITSIHPPLSALIKTFISNSKDCKVEAEFEQVWNQIDYVHHTLKPPGPIDNWPLFGMKRKIFSSLKKSTDEKPEVVLEKLFNYDDLCALFASYLSDGKITKLEGDSNSKRSFLYSFVFTPRVHGITEERRSCHSYMVSKEFWLFFTGIYGGGPAISFNFIEMMKSFEIKISPLDMEFFLQNHLDSCDGGAGGISWSRLREHYSCDDSGDDFESNWRLMVERLLVSVSDSPQVTTALTSSDEEEEEYYEDPEH